MKPPFLIALLLLLAAPAAVWASAADAEWQALDALDAGPKTPPASREEARATGLAYVARQEEALRRFMARYPDDARGIDARLRLARLLSVRSDLAEDPRAFQQALELLDATRRIAPEARQADVAFAKIAIVMQRARFPTPAERDELTAGMLAFQKNHPNDRRVAPLMAEIANLYDDQPRRKEAFLKEALRVAQTDELRARVADDLKRLSFLGQPVRLKGTTAKGEELDLAALRGKVVLVYFYATWSPPSMGGLEEIGFVRRQFPPGSVEIVGVSLDPTREELEGGIRTGGIGWPVIWERQGWESPLIRSLALNALPTLWVFDKQGRLRALNAKEEIAPLVQRLLREQR